LVFLFESNLPSKSINLRLNPLIHNHIAYLCFSSVFWDSNKSRKCRNVDLTVVFFNNSQVMLDQLTNEIAQVGFIVFSFVFKGLEGTHLLFDFNLVEGHQLEGK
jgi:hypothetical protein